MSCALWQYGLWSFQTGYTKLERFLHKNQQNLWKLLNFENWTYGEPQKFAKIRVCKVDYFILPSFLMPKLRLVAQNVWKEHPYIYIFYFWFKNEQVRAEKIRKKQKNSKHLKVADNLPNI